MQIVVMGLGAARPGAPADSTTGFHIQEHGSYKVNPDCTGSAEIHLPAPQACHQVRRSI